MRSRQSADMQVERSGGIFHVSTSGNFRERIKIKMKVLSSPIFSFWIKGCVLKFENNPNNLKHNKN
jgi:hypothetical protein